MRNIGLCDLYIAPVTVNASTTYTAGTPVKLARAISAKISEKFNSENLYSDDSLEGIMTSFDSITIELEVDKLTQTARAALYGQLNQYGMLVGNTKDVAPDVAIGFRAKNNNGKYDFYWYYVGTVTSDHGSDEFNTSADKPKAGSGKVTITCRGREKDQNYKVQINETELVTANVKAQALLTPSAGAIPWFSAVQEPLTSNS